MPSPVRRRLTATGWALVLLLSISAIAALHTGNNRLFLVVGGLVSLLSVEALLGAWNLRNLATSRKLPANLFATRRNRGHASLENHRRVLPAVGLLMHEHGRGDARASAAWIAPGHAVTMPVAWRFHARGRARLTGLSVRSRFPFGLLEHRRDLPRTADVTVFPAPKGLPDEEPARLPGSHRCEDDRLDPRRGGAGDFLDLREYQPGDPRRLIHWPTTARMGRPMVVLRGSESDEEVLVEVEAAEGDARWERSISKASGQVLHHARLGRAVGLRIGRRSWPARRGPAWHRTLLTALALLPHASEPGDAP